MEINMPETKANGQIPSRRIDRRRIDRLIQRYILIRDDIHRREAAFKLFMVDYETKKQELAASLLQALKDSGAEMVRTRHGTVSVLRHPTAPLTDPDAFMAFVRENERFDLLERRANKTGILEYAQEHHGQLPPGVKLNIKVDVGVRTS